MGTLNISITPWIFSMNAPGIHFQQVAWSTRVPPEDFSFSACQVVFQKKVYKGWIYYPHPETKQWHFQDPSVLEVMAQEIPNITYGDRVLLRLNPNEIEVFQPL
jgi:hypothetical protein